MLDSKYLSRDWHNARADFDRDYITGLIIDCKGNASQAAKRACMDRSSFYRKMRKLGITLKEVCDTHELPYVDPSPKMKEYIKRSQPWVPSGYALHRGQLKRILVAAE